MRLLKKILGSLLIGILLLAAGGYYFLSVQATQAVKTELDARIAQMNSALVMKYTSLSVNLFTRVVTLKGVTVLPAGQTEQSPLLIQQIRISVKQDAAGEVTQFSTQMQGLQIPVGPRLQAASPIMTALAKQLNSSHFEGNLDLDYAYNKHTQQAALAVTDQLDQLGHLDVKLSLGHFIPGQQSLLQLMAITLVNFQLNYQDQSLMPRLFGLLAQQAGLSLPQYQQQLVQKLQAQAASSTSTLRKQILAQFIIFCQNPQAFSLSATPATPVSISLLRPAEQDAFVDALNITALAHPLAHP